MTAPAKPRVALLGLGIMGGGMARRILGGGFPLVVHNRDRAKAEAIVAAGAVWAATPRAAAAGADLVFSMVADDVASRAMWLGENGAIAGAAPHAILVECSTLTATWIAELARAAAAHAAELVDAPVTGSKNAAANGELNFLVGGSAAALEKIRPVLAVTGRSITHLGSTGSGALMKLVNNFVCGVQLTALAEALAFLERSGLERAPALAVLTDGAPGSPLVKLVAGRMTSRDYTPNFKLALMAKDLGYAIEEAKRRGLPLATATAALETFRRAIAAGHAEQDMAAVAELLRSA
jgi:3-hydroxyisobutyrate dehydrogenase